MRSICPACGEPTTAAALCQACFERAEPRTADSSEPQVVDDFDLWDAWSLLGDVGGRVAT
jgi:hypothetical protein